MNFVITAYDYPDILEKRLAAREAHLAHLARYQEHIYCGGGMLDDEGKMKGSALIVHFDSREDLDRFISQEPYIAAGVWESWNVEGINVVYLDGKKIGK